MLYLKEEKLSGRVPLAAQLHKPAHTNDSPVAREEEQDCTTLYLSLRQGNALVMHCGTYGGSCTARKEKAPLAQTTVIFKDVANP